MAISVPYPDLVELEDGTLSPVTKSSWMGRELVVESALPEGDIREAFGDEGFGDSSLEIPKEGQLGRGMVRAMGDWQTHFRLYGSGDRILIDGETEISCRYVEHLTHGWVPALEECTDILSWHRPGTFRVYHRGAGQYVGRIVKRSMLRLGEPQTKTEVAGAAKIVDMLAAGWLAYRVLR